MTAIVSTRRMGPMSSKYIFLGVTYHRCPEGANVLAVTRRGQSAALRPSRNGSVAAGGWSALFGTVEAVLVRG